MASLKLLRGFRVDVGVVEQYGKDAQGKSTKKQLEIDFIAVKGNQKYYLQSAFSISNLEKVAQEERSLRAVADSFKKIIIVRDNIKARRNESGIVTMGLWNFLLEEQSLDV